MESEMKDLNSKPPPEPRPPESAEHDRPLLKAESIVHRDSNESIEDMEKKFAAYVRNDVYGPMGRGELPLVEKVLLCVACVTLVPIRVIVSVSLLVLYYLICRICTLFSSPNRDGEEQEDYAHMEGWRREVIVWCGRFFSRLLLFVFGFYWINETHRNPAASQDEPPSPNEVF